MYTNISTKISDSQKEKIQQALKNRECVTIRIDPNEQGNDVLALTQTQLNRLKKGKPVNIKLSKTQLEHNSKIEGGFIGAIARLAVPFLSRAAPSVAKNLGIGALTGLASNVVNKILGNGLYMKKGGCVCEIEADGKGLYLGSIHGSGLENVGDGLYLKTDQGLYDGSGIISDLASHIPLLNLII